jgi:HEAT repeat protein
MKMLINELDKKFTDLVRKPNKSKQDIVEKEGVRLALEKELNKEELDLVKELNLIGQNINSVWDLVNSKQSYQDAIPILLAYVTKDFHDRNREGIVRALAVKEAIGKASPVLLDEYNKIPKDKMLLRWSIGNTIYTTVSESDVERILLIVQDKENGMSRQMFVAALGKVKSEKVEDVLIKLLDDDEVAAHALEALVRMKSKKAREKILTLISHPNTLIKKEAQKALKKI